MSVHDRDYIARILHSKNRFSQQSNNAKHSHGGAEFDVSPFEDY